MTEKLIRRYEVQLLRGGRYFTVKHHGTFAKESDAQKRFDALVAVYGEQSPLTTLRKTKSTQATMRILVTEETVLTRAVVTDGRISLWQQPNLKSM